MSNVVFVVVAKFHTLVMHVRNMFFVVCYGSTLFHIADAYSFYIVSTEGWGYSHHYDLQSPGKAG